MQMPVQRVKSSLEEIGLQFLSKPLLVGGIAKEFYDLRKCGEDIDLVVTSLDFDNISKMYPHQHKVIFGDHAVQLGQLDIRKTVCLLDYEFLSEKAVVQDEFLIVSMEKLVYMTALAIKKPKYRRDLELMSKRIVDDLYREIDSDG